MATNYITTDITTGFSVTNPTDAVVVTPIGIVTNLAAALTPGSNTTVLGTVAGGTAGILASFSLSVRLAAQIYIGATGNVSVTPDGVPTSTFAAVLLSPLGLSMFLENHGSISGIGVLTAGVQASSPTTILNYGTISGEAYGVYSTDTTASDVWTFTNYGVVSSGGNAFYGGSEIDVAFNSGALYGAMQMGTGLGGSLTNQGVINGNIYLKGVTRFNNSGAVNANVTAAAGTTITDSGTISGVVTASNCTFNVYDTQISVSGSGDTVNLITGPNDIVTFSGATAWDNVIGSNATVNLSGALSGVVGGSDTINFVGTTVDTVSLWNTTSNWDNVWGSNGTVYLNHAITGVVGGGNTVYFNTGNDNIASLWNTNGAWDNVYGSNNTVYLSDAISGVVGGNDAIEFFYGSGDAASLWNTGGAADTVTSNAGVTGTLYINNAQANVIGNGDTIAFTYAGANSVNVAGNYETFIAQPVSGGDSITGYNSTDQIYLSASQFGTSWSAFVAGDVSQSGANTLITDPANHSNQITLVGVTASSLLQGNFHFS